MLTSLTSTISTSTSTSTPTMLTTSTPTMLTTSTHTMLTTSTLKNQLYDRHMLEMKYQSIQAELKDANYVVRDLETIQKNVKNADETVKYRFNSNESEKIICLMSVLRDAVKLSTDLLKTKTDKVAELTKIHNEVNKQIISVDLMIKYTAEATAEYTEYTEVKTAKETTEVKTAKETAKYTAEPVETTETSAKVASNITDSVIVASTKINNIASARPVATISDSDFVNVSDENKSLVINAIDINNNQIRIDAPDDSAFTYFKCKNHTGTFEHTEGAQLLTMNNFLDEFDLSTIGHDSSAVLLRGTDGCVTYFFETPAAAIKYIRKVCMCQNDVAKWRHLKI